MDFFGRTHDFTTTAVERAGTIFAEAFAEAIAALLDWVATPPVADAIGARVPVEA